MDSGQRDIEIDLESGENSLAENSKKAINSGVNSQAKALISKVCHALVDSAFKVEEGKNVPHAMRNYGGASPEGEKSVREMRTPNKSERRAVNEKCKKSSNKKSPKPPRPPRSASLDAADQKLIKELSELALLKRARIERMKALKKKKAAKESSSGGNLFAMVFTVIFCLVLISQGMWRVGPTVPHGASVAAVTADVGQLSGQVSGYPSASFIEQAGGSDPPRNLKRAD